MKVLDASKWPMFPFTLNVHTPVTSSSGGAADEGLVRELEGQEGAAGAVQFGHQQGPGRIPH